MEEKAEDIVADVVEDFSGDFSEDEETEAMEVVVAEVEETNETLSFH